MRNYLLAAVFLLGAAAAGSVAWLLADRNDLKRDLANTEAQLHNAQDQVALERIAASEAQQARDKYRDVVEHKFRPILDDLQRKGSDDEIDPDSDLGIAVCGLFPDLCGEASPGPR